MTAAMIISLLLLVLFSTTVNSATDYSINLLVRSTSSPSPIRRYCVELAQLPNNVTVNITGFGWHTPYLASPAVNACNSSNLNDSLPSRFLPNTLLILFEHDCKMTEHAWNVQKHFGNQISLLVISKRTDTQYVLTYNTTTMPVSIPVLVLWKNDFNRMNKTFENLTNTQLSIDQPLIMPKKFRPAVFLMFLLVLFILLGGNFWAADEFVRKIKKNPKSHTILPKTNTISSASNNLLEPTLNNETSMTLARETNLKSDQTTKMPRNSEPAIIYMPYFIIAIILCFAVGWLLLIFYFPKVMIYILQVMFCIGAFSSLTSCLDRLSYFVLSFRRYRIPSYNFHKPCTCQLGPLNLFTLFAMCISLILVVIWYIYRQEDWAWILQDILGAAICITVTSAYRLGNMRVITLILLGFFLYDIFFVFITPYIPFFQPSIPSSSSTTTTTTISPGSSTMTIHMTSSIRKISRNPSVMEQVALGIGTNGEVVPLLFALPMFISESEIDPCLTNRKSMLGFGDVILPGILLTFCRIFDIASGNRWPIYYTQSLISYFVGLALTHVALYVMNTAQPALLYLVPCILLSTIITGLCRRELKELYTGRRIQVLLDDTTKERTSSLLNRSDSSVGSQTNQEILSPSSPDVVVGISDTIASVTGVESR